jgi:hypothetical protein
MLLLPTFALAANPLPGSWEVNVTLQGGPPGTVTKTATVCLDDAAVADLPLGLRRAVLATQGSGPPLTCAPENLALTPTGGTWTASCQGPFGAAKGPASGAWTESTWSTDTKLEVDLFLRSLTLTERMAARRVGSCGG